MDRYPERFAKDGITDSESYLNWSSAKECADEALLLAVDAAKKAFAREDALSIDQRTEEALKRLQESLMALPASHKTEVITSASADCTVNLAVPEHVK